MGETELRAGQPKPATPSAEPDLDRIADWLKPLASPVRLRLLRFLASPHDVEEVAAFLKVTRQAARKHVDQLEAISLVERKVLDRGGGSVTAYVVNAQALFLLQDEFEKLGRVERPREEDALLRTVVRGPSKAAEELLQGPCLWVVKGLDAGRRVGLARDPTRRWTIGRDPRCDLVVAHDPYASNRHAEVKWTPQGFALTDMRSTNGTQHNWRAAPRGGEVPLRQGDIVGVGKTVLVFWDAPAVRP